MKTKKTYVSEICTPTAKPSYNSAQESAGGLELCSYFILSKLNISLDSF